MECATTFVTVSAELLLSIALATLIEELVIGGLFRVFFAQRPLSSRNEAHGPGHNPNR